MAPGVHASSAAAAAPAAKAGEVTALLRAWQGGDTAALEQLTPMVYGELRRIARRSMRGERGPITLQPTVLVHETFLRLFGQHSIAWQERRQLYGVAATMMRRILVDHARARRAAKRAAPIVLYSVEPALAERGKDMVALDQALARLAEVDPDKAKLVELRFFGGLTVDEIATLQGTSPRSVARQWAWARAWLYGELTGA